MDPTSRQKKELHGSKRDKRERGSDTLESGEEKKNTFSTSKKVDLTKTSFKLSRTDKFRQLDRLSCISGIEDIDCLPHRDEVIDLVEDGKGGYIEMTFGYIKKALFNLNSISNMFGILQSSTKKQKISLEEEVGNINMPGHNMMVDKQIDRSQNEPDNDLGGLCLSNDQTGKSVIAESDPDDKNRHPSSPNQVEDQFLSGRESVPHQEKMPENKLDIDESQNNFSTNRILYAGLKDNLINDSELEKESFFGENSLNLVTITKERLNDTGNGDLSFSSKSSHKVQKSHVSRRECHENQVCSKSKIPLKENTPQSKKKPKIKKKSPGPRTRVKNKLTQNPRKANAAKQAQRDKLINLAQLLFN